MGGVPLSTAQQSAAHPISITMMTNPRVCVHNSSLRDVCVMRQLDFKAISNTPVVGNLHLQPIFAEGFQQSRSHACSPETRTFVQSRPPVGTATCRKRAIRQSLHGLSWQAEAALPDKPGS